METLINSFQKNLIADNRWEMFLEGFKNTLLIAAVATVLGIIIGAMVAIVKTVNVQTGKLKFLALICDIYTTVIRGTPIVVQLLLMYNVVFVWSTQPVMVGILGFGINSGAYVSEIMRAGINAVDKGQMEAGRSLGLSNGQTMKAIILPQALKNVLPALGNEFIALLKETSVIGFLGVIDLTKAAERVISRTADVYFPYIFIALVYLALVYGMSYLFKKLEKRLAKSDH